MRTDEEYEQAIGLDPVDGLWRPPAAPTTRFVVFFQDDTGNVVGRPLYTDAHSYTTALKQVGVPRNHRIHSAVVHEVVQGVRVPLRHTAPTWAPSSDWSNVG